MQFKKETLMLLLSLKQRTDKFENAYVERKDMQYLYSDGDLYYFMDMETYETYELAEEQVGDTKYYIIEGSTVSLMFFEGLLLSVSVPAHG